MKIILLITAALAAYSADTGKEWWAHVTYLADDKLEGRKPGTEGYKLAAQYVATQYEKLGLKPVGGSYRQIVEFKSRQSDRNNAKLELIQDGKAESIKVGEDALLGSGWDHYGPLEAEVVFAGYGLKIPEHKIDELAGLDAKGKIVLYLSAPPPGVPGPLASHYQSGAERWKTLRAAGAVGISTMQDPKASEIPWQRTAANFGTSPALGLADPKLDETEGYKAGFTMKPELLDRLFAGTGHTRAEILDLHYAKKPLPKFPLKVKVRITPAYINSTHISSENVIAVLPGSDPKLRGEFIVLSAHLDHIGVGAPVNGDRINNGAMDNASGIASILEIAKALKAKPPKRSILFAAVTGEESGLLGSKYLAAYPPETAKKIVATVNLDMFLPIVPLKAITAYGLDESTLGPVFAEVSKGFGVATERDPEPQRNVFIRSDQYSFIRRGTPALSFKFHAAPGTPEGARITEWLKTRYHSPSDDLSQPVSLEGAAKFNEILAAFTERVGNDPKRPSWNDSSFFKRFATEER